MHFQRKILWPFGVLLTLLLAACGGGGTTPSFTLSLSPTSLTVQQGSSGSTTLTVTPQNGFTGAVSLAVVDGSGNPVPGITLSPASVTVSSSAAVTQPLTVSVTASVAANNYTLQVKGSAGGLTGQAGLGLTVSEPGSTWTPRTSGTSNTLRSVTYGGGFVAVGNGGTILTSP